MSLFDILINSVEAFLFTYFIANYFQLKNKNLYILLFSSLQFILLMYANHINNNGLWLSISIVSLMIISLTIWKKDINFDYMYIVLIYNMLIALSAYCGLLLSSLFTAAFPFFPQSFHYIFLCSFAKIIQASITILAIKKKINLSTSLDLKNWKSIILTDSLTLISMVIITYSMIENRYDSFIARFLLFTLFLLAICYRQTIIKIDLLNREKIKLIKTEELNKFNQQKLEMMEHLKNEIASTDHRMFYMLWQIEQFTQRKEYDKLEESLKKYRELMSKYKMVTNTNNPIFDCLYSLKINDFILRGINVENSIFISQKDVYNDITFLNQITGLIDLFENCQSILISMNEIGEFLTIKIIYREGIIEEEKIQIYCNKYFSHCANYNLENHVVKGIRISINMNNKYGKLYT